MSKKAFSALSALISSFVLSAVLLGCGEEQTVSATTADTPTMTATAPLVLDISAFIAEFDANRDAANAKYKGKEIDLRGPYVIAIASRGTNTQGPYFMLAPVPGESYSGTVVKCYATTEESSKYHSGQQIRVTGTVDGIAPGYSGIIDLQNCSGIS